MTTTTKITRTFQQLGLGAEILKALKENGFEEPFPIQEGSYTIDFKRCRRNRSGAHRNW